MATTITIFTTATKDDTLGQKNLNKMQVALLVAVMSTNTSTNTLTDLQR